MGPWLAGAVVYGAGRAAFATNRLAVQRRLGRTLLGLGAQGLADIAWVLFPLAYASVSLRERVGALVVPLFVYALTWESWHYATTAATVGAGATAADDPFAIAAAEASGIWRALGGLAVVTPSLLAGALLAFGVIAPGEWAFPESRPAFACEPAALDPSSRLTLRLPVPHGGELGVFTPAHRYLVIIPFTAGSALPQNRAQSFAYRSLQTLDVAHATGAAPGGGREPVFVDTGTYHLLVNPEGGVAASLACAVRYVRP